MWPSNPQRIPNLNPNFGYGVDPMWWGPPLPPPPPPPQHQPPLQPPPQHQPVYYPPRYGPVMYPMPVLQMSPAPMVPPPAPPAQDLLTRIRVQIEYYFSDENLQGDAFLKERMDRFGWVDINLIAGFNMVKSLTWDVELVKRAMSSSYTVELMGDKVRQRHGWARWILPNNNPNSVETGVQNRPLSR